MVIIVAIIMTIYTIGQRERDLLACIELAAAASAQEVAKKLKWRAHTVQYLLNKLFDNAVFKRSVFIDIHRLGYRYCGIYFSIQGSTSAKRMLLNQLKQHSRVGWLAELGGAYHYGMAIALRNPKEADEFLTEAITKSNCMIYKKALAFRLYLADLPRQYLSQKLAVQSPLSVSDGVPALEIDQSDRKVLATLSEYPDLSYRQMAIKAGLPHTTFDLRLRKLKQLGVWIGTTIELDLRCLKRNGYKVLVFARGKNTKFSEKLRKYAQMHPIVSHYIECLGTWDFELNVEAESTQELINLIEDLQERFGTDISDFSVMNILDVLKVKRYPFN